MIRAIIVDDEQLALRQLEKKLVKTNRVEVVGAYPNGTEMLKDMQHLQFDVAFLDIEMPGLSGLDLADVIKEWNKNIFIVFVTAYRDYAVQAFELDSIDYLVKPIMQERLEKTTLRIQEQMRIRSNEKSSTPHQLKTLKIICFKEFNVYHHNTPIKWKTAKVKELFAFFFTHLNSPTQRDTLIEILWPDVEYSRAKIQLHTTLSYLRKLLSSIGQPNAILFSNGSYTMKLEQFECDVHQFENLLEEHLVITDDSIEMFEGIIDHYTGDYLECSGYDWALPKAQSVRQKMLHCLQKMADFFQQQGSIDKTQEYLRLLVTFNPYSEHVVQQLMRFYVEIGNRGEAVKVYHEMKSLLLEELGILPDQSTTELYDMIVKG
ncbi:response regulator [Sporosarcina cyprini]|uniref:response regulator n=1 Tax=Sporosarcina cyprini TaxID=2910523 RepID=UPI001EDF0ED3|nr:response regulator [Sporosarcina cyprini]